MKFKRKEITRALERIHLSLAGLPITIEEASDPGLRGVPGVVLADRTNTLVILRETGRVMTIPKKKTVLTVRVGSVTFRVQGDYLIGRSGQRLRKKIRKW